MARWLNPALVVAFSTMLAGMAHIPLTPPPAQKTVLVKAMDVSATEFKWSPADITANPTIRFEQTTPTPHNIEFKEVPAGVDLGAYTPHESMGMNELRAPPAAPDLGGPRPRPDSRPKRIPISRTG